jgi:hypothetical protein
LHRGIDVRGAAGLSRLIEPYALVLYTSAMSVIAFDTHAYIKKLKAVGVPEEQAEVQAQAIADLVNDRLVTKEDLERGLKELEYRLVIRLGSMIVVAIGVIATLVKLL